jgi:hypothetical protein
VLHHLETTDTQDQIFVELLRVSHPGGIFVGSDGCDDLRTRQGHLDDLFVPVDPENLPKRLEAVGFSESTSPAETTISGSTLARPDEPDEEGTTGPKCEDMWCPWSKISRNPHHGKYHAPMGIMVTCGQSWTIKNGKLAASI